MQSERLASQDFEEWNINKFSKYSYLPLGRGGGTLFLNLDKISKTCYQSTVNSKYSKPWLQSREFLEVAIFLSHSIHFNSLVQTQVTANTCSMSWWYVLYLYFKILTSLSTMHRYIFLPPLLVLLSLLVQLSH